MRYYLPKGQIRDIFYEAFYKAFNARYITTNYIDFDRNVLIIHGEFRRSLNVKFIKEFILFIVKFFYKDLPGAIKLKILIDDILITKNCMEIPLNMKQHIGGVNTKILFETQEKLNLH